MCTDCGCGVPGGPAGHHHHHDHKHQHGHGHRHTHHHQTAHEHAPQPQNDQATRSLNLMTELLSRNNQQARDNQEHFDRADIFAVNLMSSPGAGKTSLLEALAVMEQRPRFGVIEGDLETERDAERLQARGIPAWQICTGTSCHLDATMVHQGIHHLPLDELDTVFIENVGNLVCPAAFELGAHLNIVLLSTPEGDDKVAKYPVMFRTAHLVLLTKADLLPHFDFDPQRVHNDLRAINPRADILQLSTSSSEDLDRFLRYLQVKREVRL